MGLIQTVMGGAIAAVGFWCAVAAAAPPEAGLGDYTSEAARSMCEMADPEAAIPVIAGADYQNLKDALARGSGGVIIVGGNFQGAGPADFAGIAAGTCFVETDLSSSAWGNAKIEKLTLVRVDLSGGDLSNTALQEAKMIGVNASGTSFADADLSYASWVGRYWTSNLENADFSDATMRGFRFRCGITMDEACGGSSGADFSGVDLTGASLSSFPVWGFDNFEGARIDQAILSPRAIPYLRGIVLDGPLILGWPNDAPDQRYPQERVSTEDFRLLQQSALSAKIDVPSFDCGLAQNTAEKLVCGEYESNLRRLDRDVAQLYAVAKQAGRTTLRDQRAWLRQRDQCEDRDCVEQAYEDRKTGLLASIDIPIILAPDQSRQFEEDVLPVGKPMRNSPLYKRLRKVLESASRQGVTLVGLENGRIAAIGEAVGANAHLCTLSVSSAAYDPETGWYGAETDDGEQIPLFRIWNERLEFRYSGNMGDTPDAASSFITCGARAAFADLVALGE
ncbi:pentapeptide repeat-containing protein [Parerythrobacter jejuensis]|uniref:DUF1311 domain-containing protein n=1 Tax=Parerythrobacter jejuensis TaxID=795812 RepID=A0A845AXQ4_9SPHN|nr:pentapeptide repeat-containing protein [Parerythrobacter jejuensis]MXP31538.1 hypothetical protein [Parerythrobacter jejuensis]